MVVAVVLVAAGCSGEDRVATPASTPPSTSVLADPARVRIEAVDTCGPMDGSAVRIEVDGARATTLRAEMLLDGRVVATSDPVNTTRDSLLIEHPVDPVATAENDILTILDVRGASVRVRPITGGSVLAVDRSIAPPPADHGGCG
jgi:hypothetical protein